MSDDDYDNDQIVRDYRVMCHAVSGLFLRSQNTECRIQNGKVM